MSLVERWNHVESGLEPGWTEATLSLEIVDVGRVRGPRHCSGRRGRASPAARSGSPSRPAATESGRTARAACCSRIDGEGIPGRLELVTSASPRRDRSPQSRAARSPEAWDAALAVLPADWSDVLVELELDSSADVDRARCPLRAAQPDAVDGERPGFRFRCASQRGYGASAGMVGRCLGRLDDDGITGRVRITRVLCDVHPVGTQGAVFSIGRRPA